MRINYRPYILALLLTMLNSLSYGSENPLIMDLNINAGKSKIVRDNIDNVFQFPTVKLSDIYYSCSFTLGVVVEKHFRIFGGVKFSDYKWDLNIGAGGSTSKDKLNFRYISIPIYYQITTGKNIKPHFYLNMGVEFQFLNSAHFHEDFYDNGVLTQKNNDDRVDGLRKKPISFFFQPGILIPLSKTLELTAGPKIQYQVSNTFDDHETNGHLMAISFHMGLNILNYKPLSQTKNKIK